MEENERSEGPMAEHYFRNFLGYRITSSNPATPTKAIIVQTNEDGLFLFMPLFISDSFKPPSDKPACPARQDRQALPKFIKGTKAAKTRRWSRIKFLFTLVIYLKS